MPLSNRLLVPLVATATLATAGGLAASADRGAEPAEPSERTVAAADLARAEPLPDPGAHQRHGGTITQDEANRAQRRAERRQRRAERRDDPDEGATDPVEQTWSGVASWYGPGFQGATTANGESYDQAELTAAHKELPFGSEVRVTNASTGESVVVRVNDRGPYVDGRDIDLSRAAAQEIGISGVADVELELLA